jgi:DNA-binding transcriptional regulator YdaS (Cro superfamily)
LARLIGRTSGYVSQMLNGERCPAPETRKRLMAALEVSRFEELFILEENVD